MKKLYITLTMISFLGSSIAFAGGQGYQGDSKNVVPIAEPASAPCFSYDYIDFNYLFQDFDNRLIDEGNSYGLNFSKSLGGLFYLSGAYTRTVYDTVLPLPRRGSAVTGIENDRSRLGLGIHHTLANCLDFTLEGGASYSDTESDNPALRDFDTWGWYIAPGFRTLIGESVELYGTATYSGEEGDYDWLFAPGVVFNINQSLGFKVGGEFDIDERKALVLGVRVNY